jgi:hypothetical protein
MSIDNVCLLAEIILQELIYAFLSHNQLCNQISTIPDVELLDLFYEVATPLNHMFAVY